MSVIAGTDMLSRGHRQPAMAKVTGRLCEIKNQHKTKDGFSCTR